MSAILLLLGAFGLAACGGQEASGKEFGRFVAPDGQREIVRMWDVSDDATVSPATKFFLVTKGDAPRLGTRIAVLDRVCSTSVRWIDGSTVEIGYRARTEVEDRSIRLWNPVRVDLKWLGRNPAAGC
ncbi:hypothetical protein [Sphingomonas sp. Leaf4]|uniref:hypothetical protein n=1 Tax=Sphingomonas sp. Leaf4 TaxID=2876553 RepID=UPI001E3C7274|nr:hypothetical protein [Sphingomonas sp. Leaf4]